MPLNLSQLHPKIPICLVINFQHPSNGSICQGCPNCLGLLLTCATRAARNVALPVSSTDACPVGPRSAERGGPGRSSAGLQWVWPMRKEGLVITGNLCSPHHQLPVGQSTKYRGQRLNFCLATPPPQADSLFLYPLNSQPPESLTKPPLVQPL